MNIRSKLVPAEEAAAFEQDLLDRGFLHVIKDAPEDLHPKEFLKFMKGPSETYDAEAFTFVWMEPKASETPLH
jgi:hypothetical protein